MECFYDFFLSFRTYHIALFCLKTNATSLSILFWYFLLLIYFDRIPLSCSSSFPLGLCKSSLSQQANTQHKTGTAVHRHRIGYKRNIEHNAYTDKYVVHTETFIHSVQFSWLIFTRAIHNSRNLISCTQSLESNGLIRLMVNVFVHMF